MPNRLLKEGICSSDAINMLTSDSEVLFYRLLVVSDDLGNMDGRPAIIKSTCFPLKEKITSTHIKTWIAELEKAKLIQRYESVDKKQYISILKWDQRVRAHPKYPLPSDSKVLTSDSEVPLGVGVGVGVGVGEGVREKHTPLSQLVFLGVEEQIAKDWLAIRKAKKKPFTETALKKVINQAKLGNLTLNQALTISCEEGWAGFGHEWKKNNGFNSNGKDTNQSTGAIYHKPFTKDDTPLPTKESRAAGLQKLKEATKNL